MTEETEKTDKNQKPWLFKKGQSGNPSGRPEGVKNFKTVFEEAVKKIAKEKSLKECEVEIDLVIKAIASARGGNFNYYKDIFDRVYGKASEKIDLTTAGEKLPPGANIIIKSDGEKPTTEEHTGG